MVSDPYVMLKLDAELASAARVGSHVPQRITRCHCTRERLAPPRPFIALRCAGSCIPEVCCAAPLRLRTVQRRRTSVCSTAADGNTLQKTVLEAQIATAENFRPFGQLITATDDGKEFDEQDAQLVLDQGAAPRFYIMRLPRRGLTFDRITYHASVTQCLGSMNPEPWYLVAAEPTGSVQRFPHVDDLHAFRIPHGSFAKLHQATWHAGPLFDGADSMSFFNLELADTNIVDHNTHEYAPDKQQFEVRERNNRQKSRWWTDTLREQ